MSGTGTVQEAPQLGIERGDRFEINLDLIDKIEGHQHRINRDPAADAARLASMESEGQFSDILVRRSSKVAGRYELIDGEGRLNDQKALGSKTIGARIIDANDAEAAILALQANTLRQPINPMEFAYGLKRAIDNNMPMEECMKRLGKVTPDGKPDVHYGKESLHLLELNPTEQEMVAKGILSKTAAVELSRLDQSIRSRVIDTAKKIEGEQQQEKAKKSGKKKSTDAPPPPPTLKLTPAGAPAPEDEQQKISDKTVRKARKKVGLKDGDKFVGLRAMKGLEEALVAAKLKGDVQELIQKTIDYVLGRRKTMPF